MVWLPTASVEVVKFATPLLSVPLPIVLLPSMKVTVPVGVPPVPETVAVKVTEESFPLVYGGLSKAGTPHWW